MKRKPSLAALRRKLDKVFQAYVRKRDTNGIKIGRCITCGVLAKLQAGHFIKRQHLSVRWDERNCHGQCIRCNLFLGGNEAEYYHALHMKYGYAVMDELMRLKRTTVKYSRSDLEEMIERYK